ncbi:MATE family efflux transporter [Rhodocytophaga aerolata]|uniref:Multidrug-efflux transporter n=1 Tax=Rhodocytophaga aerolata TaxID=455078 RepID=A0ABT8QYD7_9BACT|nr:MATE family efflux transporter [Rhodocytophaga aerolata]MDO1444858.1 MATE family efflux transporter [Rhodocytophaga aerolata]
MDHQQPLVTGNKLQRIVAYFKIAVKGEEKNFTSGSINKAIFMLSVPMILEMVMESLFAVVDVFFVSRLGENAVATVGLTESVLTLIYAVAIGISMAATAMIARRVGEKKEKEASEAAGQSLVLAISISVLISLAGIYFAADILRLMGGSEELIAQGQGFTRLMLGSNLTIMLLFLNNAIFRGAGDASIAMRSLWIANGINLLLDPLFIFGWGPVPAFGVTGAAMATTIGRGCGVIYQFVILFSGRSIIKINWEDIQLRLSVIWQILKISFGGMGQFLISSASWVFLTRIISEFGSDALAGYTVAIRVIIFTILPSLGLANAAATLVGQNLGAGQPARAEKSVWRAAFFNMLFLTAVSIVLFILSENIILIFSQKQEVVTYGKQCLRYICVGYVFAAYGMVISQSFNGAGDTRTPTFINFFSEWVLQIPLAYMLAIYLDLGPAGVFIAIAISLSVLAIISIFLFRRGKWKLVKI